METLLLRYVAHGRVLMAMPLIVVERTRRQLVTWIGPGTPIAYPDGRAGDGSLLPFDRWRVDLRRGSAGTARADPVRSATTRSASCAAQTARSVGWYVNLQAMLTESQLGFDTTDWQLDLWISRAEARRVEG